MQVPYLSFDHTNDQIREEINARFAEIYESKWYILGEQLRLFEEEYAEYHGLAHAIGVGNGMDALSLSMRALGVRPGEEVIVPSHTYIATAIAVSNVGATPIFVEPIIDTCNLDPARIAAAITERTRCIIPVHLYGQPCQMREIMGVASKHDLHVVEDNAQAHGALWGGQMTGTFGDINATSFYPTKNLGAFGDGGAITTADPALAEKVRSLRNSGSSRKYFNEHKGVNSRLDELQAGLLRVKLRYLNKWNDERRKTATRYIKNLADLANEDVVLPQIHPDAHSVFHLFVIRTRSRDALQQFLADGGIGTQIHYPLPPHLQKAYAELGFSKGDYPIAEEIADTALSLPLFIGMSDGQVDYVSEKVLEFYRA